MNFDTFFEMYREWQSKPHMYVVNPVKMGMFHAAHDYLKQIIDECCPDAKIEIAVNEFNDGSASITVETDDIVVKDTNLFVCVIEHASNFEIYPLNNGNMRMTITFNDLMSLIK